MITSTNKWKSRVVFAALCTWLLLGLVLAVIAFVQYGVDFRGYYAAARVLIDGGNPYDYALVSQVLQEVTGLQGNNPYYYPPWFAWLFLPLAVLPFTVARAMWMMFNYLLWNFSLTRLHGALSWSLKGWRLYGLFALTTFSFAWITWRYEQAGILILVILVELVISVHAGRWTRAGIWLALLLIKPNVTFIIAVGISLWLIRKSRWQPIMVAFFVSIGLLIVSTLITPEWYKPIFEENFGAGLTSVLDGPDRVLAYRINSTFPDWLATFGVTRKFRYVIYAVFLVGELVLFFRAVWSSDTFVRAVSVSTLISFALTPYALQYDYPPLTIPFFWGIGEALSRSNGRFVAFMIVGFVLSVILWQQNIAWAYWMVIGLAALLVWNNHLSNDRAKQAG